MDFNLLDGQSRLLIEANLKPVQGTRFQPTGFPDLGAATYQLANGTNMLLVESAQSMANRMEMLCWDEANQKLIGILEGMPYVESTLPDGTKTNSILEAHRLNSPYIVNTKEFGIIQQEIGFEKNKPFNRLQLAKTLLKFDPNSLIHGIFLEKIGGVVRLPRMLSGFIEAKNVVIAPSGGAKIDRVQPATSGKSTPYGKADDGYGNVIFPRDEYAGEVTAFFNLDLALLRGYGLGSRAEAFLTAFSMFKIQSFLKDWLHLRSACDLEIEGKINIKKPIGFEIPSLEDINSELPRLIRDVPDFINPPKTEVRYDKETAKSRSKNTE
jgi:CRISPR-associated protein Csb1